MPPLLATLCNSRSQNKGRFLAIVCLEVSLVLSIYPSSPSEEGFQAQCGCLAQMSRLQHLALATNTSLHFIPTELGLLTLRTWCKAQLFSFQMNEMTP